MKTLAIVLLFLAALLSNSSIASAQIANDSLISPTTGFQPANSYALSDIEAINEATGSLSLHIPIAQLPRGPGGFTAGVTLSYNNKYWETVPAPFGTDGKRYLLRGAPHGAWQLRMAPILERVPLGESDFCSLNPFTPRPYSRVRLVDPDGTTHMLIPADQQWMEAGLGDYCTDYPGTSTTSTWYTIDHYCPAKNFASRRISLLVNRLAPLLRENDLKMKCSAWLIVKDL